MNLIYIFVLSSNNQNFVEMKKVMLLFLVSFTCFNAYTQKYNYKLSLDSISESNVADRKFAYDERGNLLSNIGHYDTVLYTYDLNNNIISQETYDNYGYASKTKIDYTYQDNLLTSMISYNYNENYDYTNNKWNPDRKTIYTYTPTNKISQKKLYLMNNNQWEHRLTNTYIYDTNDNLIVDFNGGARIEYTYDENNNRLSETNFNAPLPMYGDTIKLVWTYDANNNVLDETPYIYENGNWIFLGYSMKFEYAYDSQNNLVSKVRKELISNQWVNNKKEVFCYDQNKNCIGDSIFNFIDGVWAGEFGYIYEFDTNNNKLSETMIQCYNSVWFFNRKTEYQFDYNYSDDDLYVPQIYKSPNKKMNHKDYTYDNNQWDLDFTYIYHYTQRNVSLDDVDDNNTIRIYPNPASEYIVIDINEGSPFEYEIFNSNGILVLKGISQNTIRVDIKDLNSGLYFCNVKSQNKLHKSKFIKI